jgi:hypothetical protein
VGGCRNALQIEFFPVGIVKIFQSLPNLPAKLGRFGGGSLSQLSVLTKAPQKRNYQLSDKTLQKNLTA